MVPWLAVSDQALIFPNQRTFKRPAEQEACMRNWIKQRTGLSPDFEVVWYAGARAGASHRGNLRERAAKRGGRG